MAVLVVAGTGGAPESPPRLHDMVASRNVMATASVFTTNWFDEARGRTFFHALSALRRYRAGAVVVAVTPEHWASLEAPTAATTDRLGRGRCPPLTTWHTAPASCRPIRRSPSRRQRCRCSVLGPGEDQVEVLAPGRTLVLGGVGAAVDSVAVDPQDEALVHVGILPVQDPCTAFKHDLEHS